MKYQKHNAESKNTGTVNVCVILFIRAPKTSNRKESMMIGKRTVGASEPDTDWETKNMTL